jgi:hypothetical protein
MSSQILLTVSNPIGNNFKLTTRQAINLELKLNVTKYGRPWITIGDALFKFGSAISSDSLEVTSEQFEFLEMLNTKNSWEDCKNL